MQTDHTAIRQRTIPARLWRVLASVNDVAGLTELDWLHLWRAVLWILRIVLIVATVENWRTGMLSYAFLAIVAVVAVNTLPGAK